MCEYSAVYVCRICVSTVAAWPVSVWLTLYACSLCMPYIYALYVCMPYMPYVYALYVCLICMHALYALCVCLICMPYMYALCVCTVAAWPVSDT